MTDPGNHRRPEPELRPQPQRPEFAVEPLRPRAEPTHSGPTARAAIVAWAGVAVVVLGLAAVVALNYDAVRAALGTTVSQNSSGATSTEIDDTVTATLLASAAAAAVLILLAGAGLTLAATRRAASGIVLLVTGLAAIGAFVLFWSFMPDAGDIAGGALRWGPLIGAGLAAIAAVLAGTGLARK